MTPERLLHLVKTQEEWQDRAACRGVSKDVFFPPSGAGAVEAKVICAGCPVRRDCLQYALDAGEDHGIWGGCCRKELRAIRRARRLA